MTNYKIEPFVEAYCEFVEANPFEHCKWQKLLIKHVRNCFRTEDLYWDDEQINTYFSYQKYFDFELFLWEKFCFILHNCVFKMDKRPRWPDLLILVGRGAGKNGYLSFEDFCLLTPTHGIKRYHIDICATNEEQAKTTFEDIYEVLENPKQKRKLLKHFYWTKELIMNRATKSILKFRTNNAKGKDGLRSGKVDYDEKHAYTDWENINVFTTGLGKKPHPRTTTITTQGDVREGPLDEEFEEAKQILEGAIPDGGKLPFICCLDDAKDVHDKMKWNCANPSLRYLPDLFVEIEKEYKNYVSNPNGNSAFMTKRMNVPQGKKDTEVTSWENIMACSVPLPNLIGRSCVVGIDYAKTTDFVTAGFLFKDKEQFCWYSHSWFCTNSADKERIKIPMQPLVDKGLLTIVNDVEIGPQIVIDWIIENGRQFDVRKIAMDNFRFSLFNSYLKNIGFDASDKTKVKMVRPSDIMKIIPVMDSVFNQQQLSFGDNSLMRWFINNAKKKSAGGGNYTYEKIEEKSRKTDGFMALVAAMTIRDDIPEYAPLPDVMDIFTY